MDRVPPGMIPAIASLALMNTTGVMDEIGVGAAVVVAIGVWVLWVCTVTRWFGPL